MNVQHDPKSVVLDFFSALDREGDRAFLETLTVGEITSNGSRVTVVGDWRSKHAAGRSRFQFQVHDGGLTLMTVGEG